jgi:hypothetical protein
MYNTNMKNELHEAFGGGVSEQYELPLNKDLEIANEIKSGNLSRVMELENLSPDCAKDLAASQGLRPENLFTPKEVAMLEPGETILPLDGLKHLSGKTAHQITKFQGAISLRGLEDISNEVAVELSRHPNLLFISKDLEDSLSDKVIEILVKRDSLPVVSGELSVRFRKAREKMNSSSELLETEEKAA